MRSEGEGGSRLSGLVRLRALAVLWSSQKRAAKKVGTRAAICQSDDAQLHSAVGHNLADEHLASMAVQPKASDCALKGSKNGRVNDRDVAASGGNYVPSLAFPFAFDERFLGPIGQQCAERAN